MNFNKCMYCVNTIKIRTLCFQTSNEQLQIGIKGKRKVPFIVVQKHEVLRYKSDKGGARFVCWKL